jgi:hypothetical protein
MTKEQYLAYQPANEDQFQAATFRYINHNYPQWRKLVFHVPNESATSDLMRMQLKSKGVVPGIPDIICMEPRWAIELKMPKGVQSEPQKLIEQVWTQNGIPYFLCRNAAEVLQALSHFGEKR